MHSVSQSGSPYMQVLCYEWASGLLTQYSLQYSNIHVCYEYMITPKLCTSAIYTTCYLCNYCVATITYFL